MNCSVPVIGALTGGIPEVIVHNETGFLFPVGEINAMAQAAIELLRDEEKLQRFSQASRQHAGQFAIEKIMPEWESYYQEIMRP